MNKKIFEVYQDEKKALSEDGGEGVPPAGHTAATKTRRHLARWRTNICEVEKQINNIACEFRKGAILN